MEEAHHPLVLHGKSGRGKTALCAVLLHLWHENSPEDVVVYRFLGTSPNSSNLLNVLQVCHRNLRFFNVRFSKIRFFSLQLWFLQTLILQIYEVLQLPTVEIQQLQNFNKVVQTFVKVLETASTALGSSRNKRLVIILDSLDQLSTQDGAHRYLTFHFFDAKLFTWNSSCSEWLPLINVEKF